MQNTRWFGMLLTACLLAAPALAQETPVPPTAPPLSPTKKPFRIQVGPEFFYYRLGTAKAADRFGGTWQGFGLGFGSLDNAKPGFEIEPEINFLFGSSGKNRAYILPLNLGGRYTFRTGGTAFYLGASGGMSGVNLRADPEQVRAGWRFTGSGSVYAGVNLSRRLSAEVRWYRVNPVRGFDLSGTNVSASLRF